MNCWTLTLLSARASLRNAGGPRAARIAWALLRLAIIGAAPVAASELRVPASTAYLEPDPDRARVSPRSGITGWQDPELKVLWYGELKHPGLL